MHTLFYDKIIGFIGAGNMAEAMIHALLYGCGHPSSQILSSDPSPEKRERMAKLFQIFSAEDNMEVFQKADILILSVKPQQMKSVLGTLTSNPDFKNIRGKKLIISIAAGIPLSFLTKNLKEKTPSCAMDHLTLVRVMPNTPSLAGEGMAGISPEKTASQEDIEISLALMETMGKAVLVPESLMDSLTALSGSGPAYVFLFAEAMIQAGVELGMDVETASMLTRQTMKGAVALLEKGDEDAASLRKKVTSPGGTTAAALSVFVEGGFSELVLNALAAAKKRSEELAEEIEKL